ncbi:magnesium transporter [Terrihabitans soli]|uniref:Magnesium transport protein CorA n=1 Tax=Terrihabitans soli TaxID=708113 RepID=A0A6S6QT45_9HYPH|nr:magnesium transporter CorA family protein [Terrihabitans soli]BCJ90221.1 magnesium transporter [Terrihabitans soli]
MLTIYTPTSGPLDNKVWQSGEPIPQEAVWLDLLDPTVEEDKAVEQFIGILIPTVEEMREIESSSRLYVENGARYMTASVMAGADSGRPGLVNVSFILAGNRLITVRHTEPRVLKLYIQRVCSIAKPPETGEAVLMGLLEAVIDRTADIIEHVGMDVDIVSQRVFGRHKGPIRAKKDFMEIMREIGAQGDLASMARESLVSLTRVVGYLLGEFDGLKVCSGSLEALNVMRRDLNSLREHTSYLNDKVTFLLDATVGMVTIEQNDLVKLFSVVSVILMPPMLIASIYGMNFEHMPELAKPWAYPAALIAMLVSAVVPYLVFRLNRWL